MSATQVGDFQAETHSVEVSADIRALIPIICGLTTGGLVIKQIKKSSICGCKIFSYSDSMPKSRVTTIESHRMVSFSCPVNNVPFRLITL